MEEKINEAVLEEVSGGTTSYNNRCPRCGAEITSSSYQAVQGIGVQEIYHCNGCNLSWIAESSKSSKARISRTGGYHMVGNELVGGSLPDLGGYNG